MRTFPKLAMLLALGGCEQPGPYYDRPAEYQGRATISVQTLITTNADYYRAGAPVSMRLTNTTGRTVGYNLCRASLERSADDDWRRMQQLGEVCTAELRLLRPGQSVTFAFRPSPNLRAGNYRIRADLQDPQGVASSLEVLSNTFNITRDSD